MQIRSHLARRLAVGAAVLAALTMGPLALTGQAGAATVTAPSTSHATSTNHAKSSVPAVCSGGKSRFKLRQTGKGFDKRALKFEARAAKAKAAGHTKRAAWFAKLAAIYQANGSRLGKRYAKMESRKSAYVAKVCAGH